MTTPSAVTSAPTPSPLPADEIRSISDLVLVPMTSMRTGAARPAKDTLHHYTTPAGFHGIVTSGKLHASFIGFMNDASEYIHAVHLLLAAVRREKPSATGADRALLDHMEVRLAPTEPANFFPYFLTCFSAAENDLSQWRSYGQGEGGFSLGFDFDALAARVATIPNTQLAPVIYNPNQQRALIDDLLVRARAEYAYRAPAHAANPAAHLQTWVDCLFLLASALGTMMKDSSFESEREWRIIHYATDQSSIIHQPKSSILSGYVELALGQPQGYPAHWAPGALGRTKPMPHRLPLKQVWVGPGRFNTLSRVAANSLLVNTGYIGIGIDHSKIPFRVVS